MIEHNDFGEKNMKQKRVTFKYNAETRTYKLVKNMNVKGMLVGEIYDRETLDKLYKNKDIDVIVK